MALSIASLTLDYIMLDLRCGIALGHCMQQQPTNESY